MKMRAPLYRWGWLTAICGLPTTWVFYDSRTTTLAKARAYAREHLV